MRTNPRDGTFPQIQTVAPQRGIGWRHEGSSHCVFVRFDGKTLLVPARRPIKPIYVRKFIELIAVRYASSTAWMSILDIF